LVAQGALDIAEGTVIGLVVETQCNYFKPIAFPDRVRAGIRVTHRGTSSVRYEVGIFKNDDDTAAAQGHFVHVYIDRASGRPVPLPDALKRVLAKLEVA
jgi:acyl-CoA thioester hydrolase